MSATEQFRRFAATFVVYTFASACSSYEGFSLETDEELRDCDAALPNGKNWGFESDDALTMDGEILVLRLAVGACEHHSFTACWNSSFLIDASTSAATAIVIVNDEAPAPEATCASSELAELEFDIGVIGEAWTAMATTEALLLEVPRNEVQSQIVEFNF